MQQKIRLLVLSSILIIYAISGSYAQTFPTTFKVEEDLVAIGSDFTLKEKGKAKAIGKIYQRHLNLTTTFELVVDGRKVCSAKTRLISIGTCIDIYDDKGQFIGSVEEEIIRSWFSPLSHIFSVKDSKGNVIAVSDKISIVGTTCTIKKGGKVVCRYRRPAVNIFTDTWDCSIDKAIDYRLVIFIPAFITYSNNERERDRDRD